MKLLEFKHYLKIRWVIIKLAIKNALNIDMAYAFDKWARILSSVVFTLSFIFYNNIIFANTDLLAGYTLDQMLLFLLFGQFSFYTYAFIFFENLRVIEQRIHTGSLDMILTKPLPSLFYNLFYKLPIFGFIVEALPPILVSIFVINWANLNINPLTFLAALAINFIGILIVQIFSSYAIIAGFWLAKTQNLLDFTWVFEYNAGRVIPFEGFSRFFQFVFLTIIPVSVSTGLSTSVALGKTPVFTGFLICIHIFIGLILFQKYLWNLGLKNYTSASS